LIKPPFGIFYNGFFVSNSWSTAQPKIVFAIFMNPATLAGRTEPQSSDCASYRNIGGVSGFIGFKRQQSLP